MIQVIGRLSPPKHVSSVAGSTVGRIGNGKRRRLREHPRTFSTAAGHRIPVAMPTYRYRSCLDELSVLIHPILKWITSRLLHRLDACVEAKSDTSSGRDCIAGEKAAKVDDVEAVIEGGS